MRRDGDCVARVDAVNQWRQRLRIELAPCADRYTHRILYIDPDGRAVRLMDAVEGPPGGHWPPSPPLQALNIDDLDTPEENAPAKASKPAMLVGVAGDGHWSMTIEPFSDHDSVVCAAFDVACRVKAPPSDLRSTYRLPDANVLEKTTGAVQLLTHGVRWRVSLTDSSTGEAPTLSRVECSGEQLAVLRDTTLSTPPPETLRWRYLVCVDSA